MKILSLFDGISCARVALERAGIPVEAYYASEVDKYAMQISAKNYPDIVQLGDITSLISDEGLSVGISGKGFLENANNIDLLIGGSPCQDLSIAKKDRKGLDGERSGLFWQYVNMLKYVKPKYFILENVNSMPKEAKAIITETLGVEPIMINAALVSAQNRKRLFWVGRLVGDTYEQVIIPQPEDRGILLKDILQAENEIDPKYLVEYDYDTNETYLAKSFRMKEKSNTIRTSGRGSGIDDKHNWDTIRIGQIGKGGQADRIYSPEGKSVGLSALGCGRGAKTGLYIVEATKKGYAIAQEGDSVDLSFPNSKTRRGRVGKKAKNIMTSQNIGVVQNTQIRKLTPTECMRLQGLPDGYCDGVSNSQQYKMLGNAFNVDVVAHILASLEKEINIKPE